MRRQKPAEVSCRTFSSSLGYGFDNKKIQFILKCSILLIKKIKNANGTSKNSLYASSFMKYVSLKSRLFVYPLLQFQKALQAHIREKKQSSGK